MKRYLVGYTGFVGSNLMAYAEFNDVFNSKNIKEAYGTNPDFLVYAGVRAEKFLANENSEADYEVIKEAFNNIKKINPKRLVLISTVDVYKTPKDVQEDSNIITDGLHPYGLNRFALEKMVRKEYPDCLIVRLPALYGKKIKKNFIYDVINIIPSMLTTHKFNELSAESPLIKKSYIALENGFYKCIEEDVEKKQKLKQEFLDCGFSALNFTDSRAYFQFYNLKYLYEHINIAIEHDIKLLNIATEPINVAEIYRGVYHKDFINELSKPIPYYDFRTIHGSIFHSPTNYIFGKDDVMKDIISFIRSETR